jgi:hypothetical protein
MEAVIVEGIVDSTVSRRLPYQDRVLREPDRLDPPIRLVDQPDIDELRRAIGAAQEKVAQRPDAKGSGNRHKRIRLYLDDVDVVGLETRLASGGGESEEVNEVREVIEEIARPLHRRSGQGRGLSAPQRQAVELRAMAVVEADLVAAGWDVEDVSSQKRGYDLHATRGAEELHVEVKGTIGDGTSVLLTPNEVRHAREHSRSVVLGVVRNITLRQDDGRWLASGGDLRMLDRWRLDDGVLEPVGYEWVLPPSVERR